jgi:hypothetical protein
MDSNIALKWTTRLLRTRKVLGSVSVQRPQGFPHLFKIKVTNYDKAVYFYIFFKLEFNDYSLFRHHII